MINKQNNKWINNRRSNKRINRILFNKINNNKDKDKEILINKQLIL